MNETNQSNNSVVNNQQENSISNGLSNAGIFGGRGITNSNRNLLSSRYVKPVHSPLQIAFEKFMKDKKFNIELNEIEEFPAWFEQLEKNLAYLGLKSLASELIENKIRNITIECQPEEETVVKTLIAATVKPGKFIKSKGTTAQEDLYNVVHSFGFIKSPPELIKMKNEFSINIKDAVHNSLRKWSVLETAFALSQFNIDEHELISNISSNFPNNISFQPLIELLGRYMDEKTVDIATVINEIHRKVNQMTKLKPIETVFDLPETNHDSNSNSSNSKEQIKIQNIMNKRSKNYKRKLNENRINKNRASNQNKGLKSPEPKICKRFDHPSEDCPNNKENHCWFCGTEGHKKRHCRKKLMAEAMKKVNAVMVDLARSTMVNHIRRDEDMQTRIASSDVNDICNGIVLDTGAQASVAGNVDNLHSYFPLSDSELHNSAAVTNTLLKYSVMKYSG